MSAGRFSPLGPLRISFCAFLITASDNTVGQEYRGSRQKGGPEYMPEHLVSRVKYLKPASAAPDKQLKITKLAKQLVGNTEISGIYPNRAVKRDKCQGKQPCRRRTRPMPKVAHLRSMD